MFSGKRVNDIEQKITMLAITTLKHCYFVKVKHKQKVTNML